MEFYISTFVFSSGIIQGIILVLALLRKNGSRYTNIFLIAFIGVLTAQIAFKFLDIYLYPGHAGPMYSTIFYLPYLYGPLLYLYIKKTLDIKYSFITGVLHFIPFALSVLIVFVSGYGLIRLFDYINNDVYNLADTAVQLFSITVYILLSKKLVNQSSNPGAAIPAYQSFINWFHKFSNLVWLMGISVIILFTLVFYKVELLNIQFSNLGAAFILLPVTIYWLSYSVFVESELITTPRDPYGTDITNTRLQDIQDRPAEKLKYQGNRLNEHELKAIIDALEQYMREQQPFLDPRLSLESLAVLIKIPRHHISQAINSMLSVNFNDYINMHRVEYARKELLEPRKQHLTIAAIAFDSGFNSISTFNETFRKVVSMTPSQYKKSMIGH